MPDNRIRSIADRWWRYRRLDGGGAHRPRTEERDCSRITVIESPEIGTIGVGEATIPPIRSFNSSWASMRTISSARHRRLSSSGSSFATGGESGTRYLHPFGKYGVTIEQVAFHHHWLRLRELGDDNAAAGVLAFRHRGVSWQVHASA